MDMALNEYGATGSPYGSCERPVGRDQNLAAAGLAAGMYVLQAIDSLDIHMEAAFSDLRHQIATER